MIQWTYVEFSCIWLHLRHLLPGLAIEICFWLPKWIFGYVHGHTVYLHVWLEISSCSLFLCSLLCCFNAVPSCASRRCWMRGRPKWADPQMVTTCWLPYAFGRGKLICVQLPNRCLYMLPKPLFWMYEFSPFSF